MILIIILYALLAATFPLGKELLSYTSPVYLIGLRMIIAGSMLLAYQFFTAREKLRVAREDIPAIGIIALTLIYLSYILEFWGMNLMPSFKACTLFSLAPFMTYAIGCTFFGEVWRMRKLLGLTIGFIGILPLLFTSSSLEEVVGSMLIFSWAEVAVIAAVFFYCFGWFFVRRLVKFKHYSPFTITGYSMLIGGVGAFTTALMVGNPLTFDFPLPFWGFLFAIIFIGNVAAYNLYARLLKHYSNTFISFCSVLEPIFGALLGWFFLHERISWQFYVTMVMVFIGLYVFYQEELRDTKNDIL